MRKGNKLVAATMLAAIMTIGVPQVKAGILLSDVVQRENPPATEKVKKEKSIITAIVAALTGILLSD